MPTLAFRALLYLSPTRRASLGRSRICVCPPEYPLLLSQFGSVITWVYSRVRLSFSTRHFGASCSSFLAKHCFYDALIEFGCDLALQYCASSEFFFPLILIHFTNACGAAVVRIQPSADCWPSSHHDARYFVLFLWPLCLCSLSCCLQVLEHINSPSKSYIYLQNNLK